MNEIPDTMPQLDSADPRVTEQVVALRIKVQKQGDPLLILRLDEILFIEGLTQKVEAFREIVKDIEWRE